MEKKIVLYTTAYCPYCHRALKRLDDKKVTYQNIDVSNNREAFKKIMDQTGWDTVPQIFIDGEFIGGCDDLLALDAQGKLDEKLGV
ncbi:glutaredoxin 3 [Fusibacter bizertensis]|jgi:Glutaredoxin, GrxC family|uniref:Glutaredoxin n=1 Tax=Fusibacter bizertensis TaxID=1488331 RepID=A0ABT6NAM6_9FIRM|nr:glutaredoxin 3 [Fusibacter bizertensis]MDH8677459.1 glutaredoxin 3 [Fusibacter bizertensis]